MSSEFDELENDLAEIEDGFDRMEARIEARMGRIEETAVAILFDLKKIQALTRELKEVLVDGQRG